MLEAPPLEGLLGYRGWLGSGVSPVILFFSIKHATHPLFCWAINSAELIAGAFNDIITFAPPVFIVAVSQEE